MALTREQVLEWFHSEVKLLTEFMMTFEDDDVGWDEYDDPMPQDARELATWYHTRWARLYAAMNEALLKHAAKAEEGG